MKRLALALVLVATAFAVAFTHTWLQPAPPHHRTHPDA